MSFKELPLTGAAQRLVEEFGRYQLESRPDYTKNIRTLTYLVYWLGAETVFFEGDVIAACRSVITAPRRSA
ncbi:hypothetical protein GCM10029978_047470 [Actinoallomurus acanthiterrae]